MQPKFLSLKQKEQMTPKQHAKEIAWTIANAILDGNNDELGKLQLTQLVAIREIIEKEVAEYLTQQQQINENGRLQN